MPLSESPLWSKLAAAWPLARWRDMTVLVAVSGGADSVALGRGLQSLAGGEGRLATAHTADDQAETVLFNILRGSGLAGLAGIPRLRRLSEATTIVRPLLDVTRVEVLDYLQSIGQSYRDDSSNRLEDYTRNRIRQ